MCGHIGFATTSNVIQYHLNAFSYQGLYVDALRGKDSTGVLAVDYKDPTRYVIYKKALHAADYLQLRKSKEILNKADTLSLMIGHNRAATRGSINDETAHPYEHGNIVLAHNGTLSHYTGMEGNFPTDSEEIAYTINKNGAKETLPKINGAYALVWWDKKENSLNLARNNEREFHYALSDDGYSIYWASEAFMLGMLLDRNKIKNQGIVSTDVGVHYNFSLETNSKLDTCLQTKFDVYTPPKQVTSHFTHASKAHAYVHSAEYNNKDTQTITQLVKNPKEIEKGATMYFVIDSIDKYKVKKGYSQTCTVLGHVIDGIEMKDGTFVEVKVRCWSFPVKSTESWPKDAVLQGKIVGAYGVKPTGYYVTLDKITYVSTIKEYVAATSCVSTDYIGPAGKLYSREKFLEFIKGGCAVCSTELTEYDEDMISWEDTQPVCISCNVA